VISERLRSSFKRQQFMKGLGARLIRARKGSCVIEAPCTPDLHQHCHRVHGGVIAAMADTASAYAAMSLMADGLAAVTVEFKISFVRPAKGTLLRATAEVIGVGRLLTVVRADVTCGDFGDAILCAEFLGTFLGIGRTRPAATPDAEGSLC